MQSHTEQSTELESSTDDSRYPAKTSTAEFEEKHSSSYAPLSDKSKVAHKLLDPARQQKIERQHSKAAGNNQLQLGVDAQQTGWSLSPANITTVVAQQETVEGGRPSLLVIGTAMFKHACLTKMGATCV